MQAVRRGSWWKCHATPRYVKPRDASRRVKDAPTTGVDAASFRPFSFRTSRVPALKNSNRYRSRATCVPGPGRPRAATTTTKRERRLSLESRLTEVERNFTDTEGTTSQPPLPQRRFCLEKVRPLVRGCALRYRITIATTSGCICDTFVFYKKITIIYSVLYPRRW